MTKITNYMLRYLLTAYDDADPVTRFIWRLRVRLMTDKEIRETYYQLTDRQVIYSGGFRNAREYEGDRRR